MAVGNVFVGLVITCLLLWSTSAFDSASTDFQRGDFEIIKEDKILVGKSKFEEFMANSKRSDCWKKAVTGMEKRCKNIGDIEQSYLAIEFTNCHLSKSGRKLYSCSRDTQSIEECTGKMDDTTYLAYTTFFTHTANICFYVKSELWQQRTEDTISRLSRTSQDVAAQLEDSSQKQRLVLENQNTSLKNQKKIISNEIHLAETLRNSTLNAKKAFEDMKQNAVEQKKIFSETFDSVFKSVERIQKLQSMILGEFISLQSVAFYVAAVCTCYFLSSTPRTAGARLPLFIALLVLIFLERLVTSWGVTDTQTSDTTEAIHASLWVCRKLFIIVGAAMLIMAGYQYQDYNKINFNLLREMQIQIRDMQRWQEKVNGLKAIAAGESSNQLLGSLSQQSIAYQSSYHSRSHDTPDAPLSSQNLDDDDDDDDDDESDPSFVLNDFELESFSEESSEEEDDEMTNNKKSTPELQTPVTKRRSKGTAGTANSSTSRKTGSREWVPQSSPSHQYNLRSRRNTPSSDLQSGSFLGNIPSPSKLKELLLNVQQRSARRYTAVVRKPRENNSNDTPLFSSDEEC